MTERESERKRKRERREREIFHLLVYTPNGCNRQGWTELKLGVWNLIYNFQKNAGTQILGPLCIAFLGALAENWIRSIAGGT